MSTTADRRAPLLRMLLERKALIAFTLVLNYGTGFWLYVLHETEGATEPGAPPGLLHWLRDSTLSLPLVALAIFLGARLARELLQRHGRGAPDLLLAGVVAVVMALYASVILSAGNPVHGYLFASTHGGHDLPLGVHIVRDGLLALTANEVLAIGLAGVILAGNGLRARRTVLAPDHSIA